MIRKQRKKQVVTYTMIAFEGDRGLFGGASYWQEYHHEFIINLQVIFTISIEKLEPSFVHIIKNKELLGKAIL